jgi:hypothetical protein
LGNINIETSGDFRERAHQVTVPIAFGLGPVGASVGAQWQSWAYTRNGNPAKIIVPETPGDYVVQYFIRQDRNGIAQARIKVE